MSPCACGGEAVRLKTRKRGGRTAFAVECSRCGKRTHWHRPNGGHIHEWEEINGGGSMSLEVFELHIGELKDYANNSKIHDEANVDAIKASIERFGMCDPVGVWKNPDGEYEIVEGHGRKLALEQLGYDTVQCVDLSHLTDDERRVYSHVHNQTTLMTELDLEIAELDFDGTDFDMTEFGFSVNDYSYLWNLMNEEFASGGTTAETEFFSITFVFDKVNEYAVKKYVKEVGKDAVFASITKEALKWE